MHSHTVMAMATALRQRLGAADRRAFLWVAALPSPPMARALRRVSYAANFSRLWICVAAVLFATGGRRGRRAALRGVSTVAVTSAATNLAAKRLTARTRPVIEGMDVARLLARRPGSSSFPSGHSASAFAFATAVSSEIPPLRPPLVLAAGVVAVSRVTAGAHYPGDVIAGSLLGVSIAVAMRRLWR